MCWYAGPGRHSTAIHMHCDGEPSAQVDERGREEEERGKPAENAREIRMLCFSVNWEYGDSNRKVREELGWEPKEKGVLEDIETGPYIAFAEALRQERDAWGI